MKIAIAQLNPIVGDLKGNAAQIQVAAEQAARNGARLLLTPELSLCGYPPRDLLLNPGFVQAMEQTLQELAQQLPQQVAVLVGVSEGNSSAGVKGTKPLFNSAAWLEAGQLQARFHKQLLPTYDVFDEDRYFASEPSDNIMVLDGVRIGISICEDLWNEESFWGKRSYGINPIAQLASQAVHFIVNISASPFCVGKQALRESMLSHSAQHYDCPILYVNQVGGNDDLIFDGRSLVVNQQGTILSRGHAFAPDLVLMDYDADLHQMKPGEVAKTPVEESAEIWGALVLGVRDYARKCGFNQAVIGLSGGIDSALVAAIATEALGADQVLGVLMPSPYSSDHSITDALALANNLGIQTQTLPIGPLMEEFDQTLAPLFAGTESGLAEENIQARIRGNLLMAIANKFSRLLISTGNKSELAVGYCTLYGDMSGGLAAIADVPKTRVYRLCQWLNQLESTEWLQTLKGTPIIPPNVLNKAPSAELKPGQVDQDSLPPYDILDDILSRSIDRHQSSAEIIAAGHDAAVVTRTLQMVSRAEFKRRQAAPGLKITDRAFGTGWRMPIAARWQM
jgi:NAD+ synthase/NAD+ synthase (glutamine-hydrolysing)